MINDTDHYKSVNLTVNFQADKDFNCKFSIKVTKSTQKLPLRVDKDNHCKEHKKTGSVKHKVENVRKNCDRICGELEPK